MSGLVLVAAVILVCFLASMYESHRNRRDAASEREGYARGVALGDGHAWENDWTERVGSPCLKCGYPRWDHQSEHV